MVDTTYANYRRLADLVLTPVDHQIMNIDWRSKEETGRIAVIERLTNLMMIRDQPETTGGEVAW